MYVFWYGCICVFAYLRVCLCVCVSYCCWHPQIPEAKHSVHIHEMDTAFSTVWCHTSLTFSLSIGFSNWSHFFTLASLCSAASWNTLISFGKYFPDSCSRCHLGDKKYHTMSTYLYIFMFQMNAVISLIPYLIFWFIIQLSSCPLTTLIFKVYIYTESSKGPSDTPTKFIMISKNNTS